MNVETGHLVRDIEQIREAARDLYAPVPDGLNRAARRALKNADETHVNLRGESGLARWARRKRRPVGRKKARRA